MENKTVKALLMNNYLRYSGLNAPIKDKDPQNS